MLNTISRLHWQREREGYGGLIQDRTHLLMALPSASRWPRGDDRRSGACSGSTQQPHGEDCSAPQSLVTGGLPYKPLLSAFIRDRVHASMQRENATRLAMRIGAFTTASSTECTAKFWSVFACFQTTQLNCLLQGFSNTWHRKARPRVMPRSVTRVWRSSYWVMVTHAYQPFKRLHRSSQVNK